MCACRRKGRETYLRRRVALLGRSILLKTEIKTAVSVCSNLRSGRLVAKPEVTRLFACWRLSFGQKPSSVRMAGDAPLKEGLKHPACDCGLVFGRRVARTPKTECLDHLRTRRRLPIGHTLQGIGPRTSAHLFTKPVGDKIEIAHAIYPKRSDASHIAHVAL
jgi:hypothetical protein